MVLYVDILFTVNWVIDFLLLHATARLLRLPHRRRRTVIGAAVGALTCLVVMLPPLSAWLAVAYKAATTLLVVWVAFGRQSLWKRCGVMFLLSDATAGAAVAVWWLFAPAGLAVVNGVVYMDVSPLLLIGCTATAYLLLCVYDRVVSRRDANGHTYQLRIAHADKAITLSAMYDSGNALREPFSGAAVAVVPYRALCEMLPPDWNPAFAAPPRGARLIPYTAVSGRGVLPAFCPQGMWVICDGKERDVSGMFVAVSGEVTTHALIGTPFLNEDKGRVALC